ncbi:hypothetical protein VRRI112168_10300 [Vreelandella rituensis]
MPSTTAFRHAAASISDVWAPSSKKAPEGAFYCLTDRLISYRINYRKDCAARWFRCGPARWK